MKTAALLSCSLIPISLGFPLISYQAKGEQHPLTLPLNKIGKQAGFSIDLNELRLVQFGDDEEPTWITEYEKVSATYPAQRGVNPSTLTITRLNPYLD